MCVCVCACVCACVCVCVCVCVSNGCVTRQMGWQSVCMLVTSAFQPSPLASAAACSNAKREPSESASPVCTKPLLSVQSLSCQYKASPVSTKPLLLVQSLSCQYKASPVSTKPLHSKPHAAPPRGDTRQQGTARTQTGLQGLGAFVQDVRHAGPSVCGFALVTTIPPSLPQLLGK